MSQKIFKFLLLTFILFSTTIFAQEFSVSGILVDNNEIPIEGSEIIIFTKNSVRASAVTDSKGYFFTTLETGVYTVRCFFIGQIIYQTDIELNQNINLTKMYSFDAVNQLEGVELTGKKKIFETKVDRTVFNVENSIRANGGDALDMLKGTPGVRVKSNAIDLVGKSSVKVMVDDRIITLSGEELNNYLKSIPSENIKSIEVITTPPAKYDAEGNSGLINIVQKKTKENSWVISSRNVFIQNTYSTFSSGLNFSYQKNKLSLMADIAGRKGASGAYETMDTDFVNSNSTSRLIRKDFMNILQYRFSIDYKLTEKATIGGNGIFQNNKPDIKDRSTNYFESKTSSDNDFINRSSGYNASKVLFSNLNAHYIQKLDTIGKQFSVDFDYFGFNYDQDRDFQTQNFDATNTPIGSEYSIINSSKQDIANYSGKIDFDIPLKWATLGFGGKISLIRNLSDIAFYDTSSGNPFLDPNQTNVFDYQEDTQAAYINFNKELSSKWQTQIGFRYETTKTEGFSLSDNQTNKNDYSKLFPTFYLVFTPNDNHNFSINYNKRIQRPNFMNLNPFKWYLNNYFIQEGNPFLQPSFTDKVEFTHNYKYKFTTNIYFSKTSQGNLQIPEVDPETNITRFVFDNIYTQDTFGINLTYTLNFVSWWESSLQASYFNYQTTLIKNINAKIFNGNGSSFATYNSFVLHKSKRFSGEINYFYNSPYKYVLNSFTQYSTFDIGLRFVTPNKKWSFAVNGFDLFKDDFTFGTSEINNTPQTRSAYHDNRNLRISINYKFGNSKIRFNDRQSGNSDEKSRVN